MALPKTGFGHRTTAEHALRGHSLSGKRAIVTGASSGLGVETTRVLALAGADVVMACRSVEAGEKVAEALHSALGGKVKKPTVQKLDLTDLESVRAFAGSFRASNPTFDLLVNNAGVMATPFSLTAQGYELQMGTNHLGHFLLTTLLQDLLAADGRVVNLSSELHQKGTAEGVRATLEGDLGYEKRRYTPFGAYGDSKLANVLFTKALAKRLGAGQSTFAVHPGVIPTNLTRSLGVMGRIYRAVGGLFLKTVPQGAATSVFAATAPELFGHSGVYLADSNEKTPSKPARDEALAEEVWSLSVKRTAKA